MKSLLQNTLHKRWTSSVCVHLNVLIIIMIFNDVRPLLKCGSNKDIPSEVLLRNDSCWVVFYSVHWKQQWCGNLMKVIKLNSVPFKKKRKKECIWWTVASKADMLSPVSGLYVEIMVEVNKNSIWSNIWMCVWDFVLRGTPLWPLTSDLVYEPLGSCPRTPPLHP